MKCPSALVLTVNTCFLLPYLYVCMYICDSFNHYGAKRQKKNKIFLWVFLFKNKTPINSHFSSTLLLLTNMQFLELKEFFMEFCPKCASHFRKDFFLWIWKSQHTVLHIYFTQSTFWLYIWIGYIPKCIIHCNLNRTIIYILFTCWHKKHIFQWRNRIIHIPKSYTIFKNKSEWHWLGRVGVGWVVKSTLCSKFPKIWCNSEFIRSQIWP